MINLKIFNIKVTIDPLHVNVEGEPLFSKTNLVRRVALLYSFEAHFDDIKEDR